MKIEHVWTPPEKYGRIIDVMRFRDDIIIITEGGVFAISHSDSHKWDVQLIKNDNVR